MFLLEEISHYTDYFLNKRKERIGSWDTPKSQGQYIGKVLEANGKGYKIENSDILNNGDGLYFLNENEEADGAQINVILNFFRKKEYKRTVRSNTN